MKYELISFIKKNPKNPRIVKDEGFKKLKESLLSSKGIQHFEARPCIVSTRTGENIIIAGNTRYQAAKELGWKEVPTVIWDGLTEAEEQEIIIRDNVSNGEWDWEILANEFEARKLSQWGLEAPVWDSPASNEPDEKYSQKVGTVTYEPKETQHEIADLYKREYKFDEDISKIENKELQELFQLRVSYFTEFNYAKIADYYAYQANTEEQRVMERLALVLLDKAQIIENGFHNLIDSLTEEDNE